MDYFPFRRPSIREVSNMHNDKDNLSRLFLYISGVMFIFFLVLMGFGLRNYSHLSLILCFVFLLIFSFYRPYFIARKEKEMGKPDMPIWDVIDYMVNDSTMKLKRGRVIEKGEQQIVQKGAEHQDALEHVQSDLIDGKLRSWGKRQMGPRTSGTFEDSLREIPKEYWKSACLEPLFCFRESKLRQTAVPENSGIKLYRNLTLNKREARSIYPPKPLWRRNKKERITY